MLFCSRDFFFSSGVCMYLLSLIIASHIKILPSSYRVVAVSVVAPRKKNIFFCPQLRKKNCSELWEYIKMCCALLYVLRLTNYSLLLNNTTLADIRVLLHVYLQQQHNIQKKVHCVFFSAPSSFRLAYNEKFSLFLALSILKVFSSLATRARSERKK
jgi:hypothetical protein